MIDYDNMTQEDFDQLLSKIMDEVPASHLLTVPGIYEILSEHFNNDVLEAWNNEKSYLPECSWCQAPFKPKEPDQKHCSEECYEADAGL